MKNQENIPNEEDEAFDKKNASITTDPGEYLKKKLKGKDLLEYVNIWAISHSFKVNICEGYKVGKKGVPHTTKF